MRHWVHGRFMGHFSCKIDIYIQAVTNTVEGSNPFAPTNSILPVILCNPWDSIQTVKYKALDFLRQPSFLFDKTYKNRYISFIRVVFLKEKKAVA